jgi:hypothetical protein
VLAELQGGSDADELRICGTSESRHGRGDDDQRTNVRYKIKNKNPPLVSGDRGWI